MTASHILQPTGRCHACGAALAYGRDRRLRYYCSVACLQAVPPRLARAMAESGDSDPRACVLRALRETETVEAAARALGVDKQALYAWIRRLGIRREVVWS